MTQNSLFLHQKMWETVLLAPFKATRNTTPRSLLDDDPVHLLQEYLGGEGGRDRGEDRAHRPVGDPVAVAGQLEGHPVQVLEHVDAPEIENERGIVKKEYSSVH